MTHDTARVQEDLSLLELLVFLARYKKFIIALSLGAMVLALVWSVVRPDEYRASAKLLPSQESSTSLLPLASELGLGGSLFAVGKAPSGFYVGVLKSNAVLDALITRFDLQRVYGTDSREEARNILKNHTRVVAGKDGFITITVKDEGRERVAGLVNAYVDEINHVVRRADAGISAQQRQFLARELASAGANVSAAERALRQGMTEGGMANPVDKAGQIAATIGALRARISQQLVKIDAADAFLNGQHPEYRQARQELASLQAELARLSGAGATPAASETSQDGSVAAQLGRNLKSARDIYDLIAARHELTQMNVAEDATAIQVIDAAVVPEAPVDPERVLNILRAGLAAAILATAACFVAEARRALQSRAPAAMPAR